MNSFELALLHCPLKKEKREDPVFTNKHSRVAAMLLFLKRGTITHTTLPV